MNTPLTVKAALFLLVPDDRLKENDLFPCLTENRKNRR
jgi:hypothetical protein